MSEICLRYAWVMSERCLRYYWDTCERGWKDNCAQEVFRRVKDPFTMYFSKNLTQSLSEKLLDWNKEYCAKYEVYTYLIYAWYMLYINACDVSKITRTLLRQEAYFLFASTEWTFYSGRMPTLKTVIPNQVWAEEILLMLYLNEPFMCPDIRIHLFCEVKPNLEENRWVISEIHSKRKGGKIIQWSSLWSIFKGRNENQSSIARISESRRSVLANLGQVLD